VRNIDEAFDLLIPEEAKNKKSVQRQGEWFAVPIPAKEVPPLSECLAFCEYEGLCLPVEDADSNKHVIVGEGRVGPDGRIFMAPKSNLDHNEHMTLRATGWVYFVRNTAVRSVSVEGVD